MDLKKLHRAISESDARLCVVVKPGETEKQPCDNESCRVWLTWANYEGCILRMGMASLADIADGGDGFDFGLLLGIPGDE